MATLRNIAAHPPGAQLLHQGRSELQILPYARVFLVDGDYRCRLWSRGNSGMPRRAWSWCS